MLSVKSPSMWGGQMAGMNFQTRSKKEAPAAKHRAPPLLKQEVNYYLQFFLFFTQTNHLAVFYD
ncbi:DUF6783 domain-containing protein [[Clostridium] symbiosum]|uniref:DUF6783 domain-containing protein n=1 Tax=Clostridium symbiosum TaxID=1512 RepID=UPI003A7F43DF